MLAAGVRGLPTGPFADISKVLASALVQNQAVRCSYLFKNKHFDFDIYTKARFEYPYLYKNKFSGIRIYTNTNFLVFVSIQLAFY